MCACVSPKDSITEERAKIMLDNFKLGGTIYYLADFAKHVFLNSTSLHYSIL